MAIINIPRISKKTAKPCIHILINKTEVKKASQAPRDTVNKRQAKSRANRPEYINLEALGLNFKKKLEIKKVTSFFLEISPFCSAFIASADICFTV